MERTIISHNVETATARIRFEHEGVTFENDFDLWQVIPGTRYVFESMGLDLDEGYQELAINRITDVIQLQIEQGAIQNPPEPEVPEYVAPPEPEEEEPEV